LIQPCACRGSLSGVHAACVEQWVRHQRQNGTKSEPRCPTCNHVYTGQEHALDLLTILMDTAAVLREPAMTCTAVMFPGAALSVHQYGFAAGFQCVIVALFYLFVCHKSAVITVSLGSEPRFACLRRFYISHSHGLHGGYTMDFAFEACAVLFGCYMKGWGSLPCLLPILAIAIVPFVMLTSRSRFSDMLPSVACVLFAVSIYASISHGFLFSAGLFSGTTLVILKCVALTAALAILSLAWLHKHPLNAGPHLANTVLAVGLGLSGKRQLSALALAFHVLVLATMLYAVARAGLKLRCTNDGIGWWLALTILPLPLLFKDVTFSAERTADRGLGMVTLHLVWASLMLALVAAALRHECLGAVQSWRQSTKVFRLSNHDSAQKTKCGSDPAIAVSTNV